MYRRPIRIERLILFLAIAASQLVLPAFAATTDATGSIAGTVTASENGQPLAGVTVSVLRVLSDFNPVVVASAQTDANGNYQVDGLDPGMSGTYVASADGGSFRINQRWPNVNCPPTTFCVLEGGHPDITAGEVTSGIDFSLGAAGAIHLSVNRADTNAPIGNASISPFEFSYTNENGILDLGSVPPGSYAVSASANGFVRKFTDGIQCDAFNCDGISVSPLVVTAGEVVDAAIDMQPGVAINGKVDVSGSSDHPNRFDLNYHVRLYDESDPGRAWVLSLLDSSGRYVFDNLLPRTYSVRFGDPEDTAYVSEYYDNVPCIQDPCDLAQVTQFAPSGGEHIDSVDAVVGSRQLVTGRVVDAVTGSPLADAEVDALVPGGPPFNLLGKVASARTDAQGRYALQGIPASDDFTLAVTAPRYLGLIYPDVVCDQNNNFCSNFTVANASYLSVGADQTLNVDDIPMNPSAVISGHVINATTNRPLADAFVSLYTSGSTIAIVNSDVRTTADGYYEMPGLNSGNGMILIATSVTGESAQMFDGVTCSDAQSCQTGLATTVDVVAPGEVSGIDFVLSDPDAVFSAGFDH